VLAVGSDFKLGKKPLCKFGTQTVRGKMLTTTLIECLSPPVESPRVVPLSILYEDDAMSFESVSMPYTYYDDPIISEIQPPCGPNYGYTQLSIVGKNFVDMGFGLVKCVFNETIWMNATIVDEHLIKCSTPPLSEELEWLPEAERFYFIGLSLNGEYVTSSNIKFGYYNDPVITEVKNAAFGPVHGGTKSELTGEGFKQMYVCNLKVRFGGIETTP
jgi:hypothetical protein